MNKLIPILIALAVPCHAFAQADAPPRVETRPSRAEAPQPAPTAPAESNMLRFDLDFPGGTPRELVRAVEKASGNPLNAIVPEEHANVRIPALKMSGVNVAELFDALVLASRQRFTYVTGSTDVGGQRRQNVQHFEGSFGFRTKGTPRDNSIWYFYQEKPPQTEETKVCRFWQLEPYLAAYQVEDITTAIQTGYRMLGEPAPTMNFHKDTKLLIAVGEADKLHLIDSVLRELPPVPGRGRSATPSRSGSNTELQTH